MIRRVAGDFSAGRGHPLGVRTPCSLLLVLALSRCAAPVEAERSPAAARAEPPPNPPSTVEAPPVAVEAPARPGCVEPLPRERLTTASVAWRRVGTSRDALAVYGIEGAAVVAAAGRTHVVQTGEVLRETPERRRGLPSHPVIWAGGRWPEDAWVVTDEGVDERVPGSAPPNAFFVWRWAGDRWTRPDRRRIHGDAQVVGRELMMAGPARVLLPSCPGDERGVIALENYGTSQEPARPLPFPTRPMLCPRLFFLPGSEEFFAPDDGASEASMRSARWCGKCEAPRREPLELVRCGGTPAPRVTLGLQAAQRGDHLAFVYERSREREGVRGNYVRDDFFVVTLRGAERVAELAPPEGKDYPLSLSLGPDGALWMVTTKGLWRRSSEGVWAAIGLPDDVEAAEQVVALGPGEVWLVSATKSGARALDRGGAEVEAPLDLERGKPLRERAGPT